MTSDLSQEKREKILAAAKARFLYYGVSKTTMRDIADDMSIAVSNLYLYFENKREMVLAIAEQCREEQDATLQIVMADLSLAPGQKLETLLVNKFRIIQEFRNESPKGKELIAYLLQEFPERTAQWQQHLEAIIRSVLEAGKASNAFKIDDVPYTARMLRIATAQFFLPANIDLPKPPTEKELIELLQWFLSLISAPSHP